MTTSSVLRPAAVNGFNAAKLQRCDPAQIGLHKHAKAVRRQRHRPASATAPGGMQATVGRHRRAGHIGHWQDHPQQRRLPVLTLAQPAFGREPAKASWRVLPPSGEHPALRIDQFPVDRHQRQHLHGAAEHGFRQGLESLVAHNRT